MRRTLATISVDGGVGSPSPLGGGVVWWLSFDIVSATRPSRGARAAAGALWRHAAEPRDGRGLWAAAHRRALNGRGCLLDLARPNTQLCTGYC